jgi:hypothetical protein
MRSGSAYAHFILQEGAMDLAVWLPSLFLLGLVGLAAMFAFIAACDRV